MVKVRFIRERLDDIGDPVRNPQTDRPLVNGGSIPIKDSTGKLKQRFPGETFELPSEEAKDLVKNHSLSFELEDDYQARMRRIAERRQVADGRRYELQQAMSQGESNDEDKRKMRAMIEERDRQRAIDHARAIKADESLRAKEAEAAQLSERINRVLELSEKSEKRLAEIEAQAAERAKADAARIAELQAMLDAATKPATAETAKKKEK